MPQKEDGAVTPEHINSFSTRRLAFKTGVMVLIGCALPISGTSVAYSVLDLYPVESSLYVGRYNGSLLTDSSGWLLRIGYDEVRPAHFFYPPSVVSSPNSQMVDMIVKGCPEYGCELLGIGYFSIRKDMIEPDADILTMRHPVLILCSAFFLTSLFFVYRRASSPRSTSSTA